MDSTDTVGSLPKEFGRYHVEQVLGEGAMGVVYLSRDSTLDRQLALKVPKTDDLILWSYNHTSRFPRQHRVVLADFMAQDHKFSS